MRNLLIVIQKKVKSSIAKWEQKIMGKWRPTKY